MSVQTVYFNNPSTITGIQNQLSSYSQSFSTNQLNVQTIQFANDNVFGNVNSATGTQWVTYNSTGAFVTCEDNYAAQAALQCLQTGGNAFDAAVTAMAVLGLTRPGNCGLGGGGYALMYHAATNRVDCIDFRETAPLKIDPYCFSSGPLYAQYNCALPSLAFNLTRARQNGYSVGVPGTPAFMKDVLERYGTFNLGQCFYPAIQLATGGFYLDQSFQSLINSANPNTALRNFTTSRNLFLDPATNYTGSYQPGYLFKNPDYANTLQICANTNMKSFYYGSIAQDIISTVVNPPTIPVPSSSITGGNMALEDLALYNTRNLPPLKVTFRDCEVYLVPPSTSGGLLVAQALKIYENLIPSATGGLTGAADSYFARMMAMRYAFADRNAFVADPLFFPTPTQGMIDPNYIASRAALCPTGYNNFISAANAAPFGSPTGFYAYGATGTISFTPGPSYDPTQVNGSTTPIVIKDNYGNVVSITFTLEQIMGSGMTVPGRGFLLNNELTDFNPVQYNTLPTANAPQPCKRPRSSMSPAIIFKNGLPFALLSSAGGAGIPMAIFNAIVNFVDYGYTTENALLEGRYFENNGTSMSTDSEATAQKTNPNSLFTLLTTYKGYPTASYFSFASAGATPSTTMCVARLTSTGASCGLNWPSTFSYASGNYRVGSSKAVGTISYTNTGTWTGIA